MQAFILNAALVMDGLWLARNLLVHQQKPIIFEDIIARIWRRYVEHSHAWMEAECFASKKWVPPPCGWLKVNMDVAIRQNGSYIAIFVRDSYSSLCLVYIERLVAMDPIVREAFVLAEAVSLAQ